MPPESRKSEPLAWYEKIDWPTNVMRKGKTKPVRTASTRVTRTPCMIGCINDHGAVSLARLVDLLFSSLIAMTVLLYKMELGLKFCLGYFGLENRSELKKNE